MEERNVGTKRKSPKESLGNAKVLTMEILGGTTSPTIDHNIIHNLT